jgi:hypothetical protein
VYNGANNVHASERPSGNSRAVFLRRLRKDRPDLHARVLAGELTPHAGMVAAGSGSVSHEQAPPQTARHLGAPQHDLITRPVGELKRSKVSAGAIGKAAVAFGIIKQREEDQMMHSETFKEQERLALRIGELLVACDPGLQCRVLAEVVCKFILSNPPAVRQEARAAFLEMIEIMSPQIERAIEERKRAGSEGVKHDDHT